MASLPKPTSTHRDAIAGAALTVAERSYVPYSGYAVGAACLTVDGSVYVGCNVENASYGLTLCAEAVMLGTLIADGASQPLLVACRHASGAYLTPCGRCRQMLVELAAPECQLIMGHERIPMGDLLPRAWTGDQMRFDISWSNATRGGKRLRDT